MTPPAEPRKPYPRGTYTRIAVRLGVTPQAVRLVALDLSKSRRIAAELKRVERNMRRRKVAA